ncbi:methyltransferase [Variovorax sp. PMC12]|uniref:methyltransferase n=1 Tax=Variovorax sp. PMC12 TaxID=2126319 RepID=UPI000D121BE4|nr:methyltransferase [Variovorax sp. PMC12]AVQ84254.1 SAM-dependent methyltransferase [Variovorax sp. PMC12]
MSRIAPHILSILERADTDGAALRLTGQLDRKNYAAVNAVLEAVGGKWNKKAKAHLFECDADDALEQILLTGEVVTKKSIQQEFGFFPTPDNIAHEAVAAADIEPGMLVLEPSAGHGALAEAVRAAGGKVECVEVLMENVAELERRCLHVTAGDFLEQPPRAIYDRVVMNPPFAKQADIKHVLHALKFVKPGGRLVAIMSNGLTFRSDRRTAEFNATVESLGGSVARLPDGSFKASGTMVSTIMVVLDVPGGAA